jgi:diguanylate cyclase
MRPARRGARSRRAHDSRDLLTGLFDRAEFRRRASGAIEEARALHQDALLVLVDLDNFRQVNAALGVRAGDEFLAATAERLRQAVRSEDTVARVDGNGFGLVLRNVEEPLGLLSSLRSLLEREIRIDEVPVAVAASIGFALAPLDGSDIDTLLQRAELAMYAAKAARSGVVAFHGSLENSAPARLALMGELRHALEQEQLHLHYQPKLDIRDGAVSSVESLVRWEHPELGPLAPDYFVALAEQSNLIDCLTDFVVTRAITEIDGLGALARHLSVAVNISPRSLVDGEFATRFLELVDIVGFDPRRIIAEVTESALVSDPEQAAYVLAELRREGVRISLDDFGRGQTSLAHLAQLPLDELKIDGSFVSALLASTSSRAIVQSVIELGHRLELDVVAEGVENAAMLRALRDAGCDRAQGFLLARPMPIGELAGWLSPGALLDEIGA